MKTTQMTPFASVQSCTALPARGSRGSSRLVVPASVQWALLALYIMWHRALLLASRLVLLCTIALLLFGWSQVSAGAPTAGHGAAVMLAQGMPSLQPVIDVISEVMLVVGGIVIFAGAIRLYRGEVFEAVLSLVAGALIAGSFVIIKFLFSRT